MDKSSDVSQALDEAECRKLLSVGFIGRAAFVASGELHLIPLNYAYRDDVIYFRTSQASTLATLTRGKEVVFETDHYDGTYQNGWSVIVNGRAEEVDDPQLIASLRQDGRPRPWASGDRDVYIQIATDKVTGRRVHLKH